jgi:hypothetical protein
MYQSKLNEDMFLSQYSSRNCMMKVVGTNFQTAYICLPNFYVWKYEAFFCAHVAHQTFMHIHSPSVAACNM